MQGLLKQRVQWSVVSNGVAAALSISSLMSMRWLSLLLTSDVGSMSFGFAVFVVVHESFSQRCDVRSNFFFF
jgi:hypothetical protein